MYHEIPYANNKRLEVAAIQESSNGFNLVLHLRGNYNRTRTENENKSPLIIRLKPETEVPTCATQLKQCGHIYIMAGLELFKNCF
jgi:hypothetical protein